MCLPVASEKAPEWEQPPERGGSVSTEADCSKEPKKGAAPFSTF